MVYRVLILWVVGFGAFCVLGQQKEAPRVEAPAADVPKEPVDLNAVRNEKSAKKLQKPISVKFIEQPLGDILANLADTTGVDVVADWKSLAVLGVTKDRPVSLILREPIEAEIVFRFLLRSLGGNIDVNMEHGVLMLQASPPPGPPGPPEAPVMSTQAYDVTDLITKPTNDAPAVQAEKLIGVVTELIAPDSWRSNGGMGTVKVFNNKLIVKNTEAAHTELAGLLLLLREKKE